MQAEIAFRLGIPALDERIGTIKSGYLILIEGSVETYPYLLLHRIGFTIARDYGLKITYIVMFDDYEEYYEASVNVGLDIRTLRYRKLWKYVRVDSFESVIKQVLDESEKTVILVDATSAKIRFSLKELAFLKNSLRNNNLALLLAITPELLDKEEVAAAEKIANIVLRLHYKIVSDEPRYIMELIKHKTMPKNAVILTYSIGALGVRIERLQKIPS